MGNGGFRRERKRRRTNELAVLDDFEEVVDAAPLEGVGPCQPATPLLDALHDAQGDLREGGPRRLALPGQQGKRGFRETAMKPLVMALWQR